MRFDTTSAQVAEEKALASLGYSQRVILCGHPTEREKLNELSWITELDPRSILAKAEMIDAKAWFERRRSEVLEDEFEGDESELAELEGVWPDQVDGFQLSINRHQNNDNPEPEALVAELSISHPSEVLAHFRYGDWNDCPEPSVHCALWRHWYEEYGAEIVGVTRDVVEAIVARPPATRDAATSLAWEQYWYCSDVVDQELGSVRNLAAKIMNRSIWHFWWD